MTLRLALVFVSALVIFKVGAFPSLENEAVVAPKQSNVGELTSATTEACKHEGGLCVIKSQCPQQSLSSKKGLCGGDKECCHSLPDTIVGCEERGGTCRLSSECKKGPRDPLGRCDTGHVCCILIR